MNFREEELRKTVAAARGRRLVYIVGPMSGYENHNFPAFAGVAKQLRKMGYNVISPHEMDEAEGGPKQASPGDEQWRRYLRRDLAQLLKADAIIALDGWEHSQGAALEVHVARKLGVPIFDTRGKRVRQPSQAPQPTELNILESAAELVGGVRQQTYGHPAEDFARTARMWTALTNGRYEFQPREVALFMLAVKLSRLVQTPERRDSVVDLAGYARTYEMVAEREGHPLE